MRVPASLISLTRSARRPGQAQAVGAERVRQNNLPNRLRLGTRDGGDFFRTGQVPEVRHFTRRESARLELRAQAPSVSTGPWAINC